MTTSPSTAALIVAGQQFFIFIMFRAPQALYDNLP
jgi:hypothetical protein